MKILIKKTGEMHFIYDDSLTPLLNEGKTKIERVSNVEPSEGGWTAYMKDGTTLGPYRLRSEALRKEVEYLEKQMFGGKVEEKT